MNLQNGIMEMDEESFSANNFLKEKLRENVVQVQFVKRDESVRKMRCTLRGDMLPEQDTSKTSQKKRNDESLAVWDLEKEAWRSFRYDSVIGFTVEKDG